MPHRMSILIRVKDGAEWLDNVMPDWREKIDTHLLNMNNVDLCILGQLYREEAEQSKGRYLHGYDYGASMLMSYGHYVEELGFDASSFNSVAEEMNELREAWIDEIGCQCEGTDQCHYCERMTNL